MQSISQSINVPKNPRPIIIIGAGGIVRDAHLPAYQKAGYSVLALYDIDIKNALNLQKQCSFADKICKTMEEAVELGTSNNAIFDIAVPAKYTYEIIKQLPDFSTLLIQKPLGETYEEGKKIYDLCKEKSMVATVNFQLKFAPYMLAAKDIIGKNLIGDVFDWELKVCVFTPWNNWSFLFGIPRVEILYHSIHYLDLCRSFLGNPNKVYASTVKHPLMKELANTRSTIIMDFDQHKQARVITNHGHNYGTEHQESYLKIEGTEGAIKIIIGTSLDYPKGIPSQLYYYQNSGKQWVELPVVGEWLPDAFVCIMSGFQNYIVNNDDANYYDLDDALDTMQLVELAYRSSEQGGILF